MTLRTPRRLSTAVALLATLAACSRGTSVGSPSPSAGPSATTSPAAPAMPAGVTPAAIAEGKTLYEATTSNCVRCHGIEAKGGQRGPDLTDATWVQIDGSYPSIVRIITAGVPATAMKGSYQNAMRARGGAQLTDAQINSIAAYLYSISHK